MKTVTFAIAKGGVGKSLLTANIAATLALRGKKVVIIEGDTTQPLQFLTNLKLSPTSTKLDNVVERNLEIEEAIYQTNIENLFLIPSGISLGDFFNINPIRFAEKLATIKSDFIFIDVPFPMGEAAILSLGFCQYFIPILTEDEFSLCVTGAIDTIDVGMHYLKCTPVGYIVNRIKTDRFKGKFLDDLDELLELPCIALIKEDPDVTKSYGGAGSSEAYIAYQKLLNSDFSKQMERIADVLTKDLPKHSKSNPVEFLHTKVTMVL